jgi:hypothetical protein
VKEVVEWCGLNYLVFVAEVNLVNGGLVLAV